MTNSAIFGIFVGIYLVAVFVGSLALLRLRRENQELRDRIEAMERERYHQSGRVYEGARSRDAEQ